MRKAFALIAFMAVFGYITVKWAITYDTFVISLAILIGSWFVNWEG